jgi:hypothetical protein
MSDLPIACSLTPAALNARKQGLLSDLLKRAQSHEELPQGHRLEFGPTDDTLARRVRNLGLFALAAVLEIAGCFAFWLCLRRGVSAFVAVLGVVSLAAFAVVSRKNRCSLERREPCWFIRR